MKRVLLLSIISFFCMLCNAQKIQLTQKDSSIVADLDNMKLVIDEIQPRGGTLQKVNTAALFSIYDKKVRVVLPYRGSLPAFGQGDQGHGMTFGQDYASTASTSSLTFESDYETPTVKMNKKQTKATVQFRLKYFSYDFRVLLELFNNHKMRLDLLPTSGTGCAYYGTWE